jgi:uncharacterized protein (DUF433 family)
MNLPEFLVEWPYGEIVLAGHRIGPYSVVARYQEGFSPERLHERYPTLSPELIDKVLAFYEANRDEVDAYVARYRADLEEQSRVAPKVDLEKLKQRMRAMGRLGPDDQWR